jgi:hypothetical protein
MKIYHRVYRGVISDDPTSTNEVIVRSTGGRTILLLPRTERVQMQTDALFSTTEPVSWTTPPSSQNVRGTAENIGRRSKPAGRVTKTNAAIHRCPNTGLHQGLAPDDDESERADNFVGVTRFACSLVDFVNPNPGKRADEERMELRA